ncbi:hypothetical protein [Streptomyces tricolor]|uniref:hypothetical protein n=1 Tax=Streptomyces tricolor TaxID=68277 RepID=UPI0036EA1E02
MRTVQDVLGADEPSAEVVLRDPRTGELGWIVQRNGALYAAEYRLATHAARAG